MGFRNRFKGVLGRTLTEKGLWRSRNGMLWAEKDILLLPLFIDEITPHHAFQNEEGFSAYLASMNQAVLIVEDFVVRKRKEERHIFFP